MTKKKLKIKKISQNIKKDFCSYFFNQSAFHTQEVATHCKEHNKKES